MKKKKIRRATRAFYAALSYVSPRWNTKLLFLRKFGRLPDLNPLARGLMIVIWSLALLGILFKLTIAHRFKILSLVTYLAMGWLSLVVIYEMAVKLAAGSVTLLAVGGVVYSLGVIFYVCKRIPYNHAIWHGFVLGGSVCHFLAIYLYIGQA